MNSILNILYSHAMEDPSQYYLTHDQLRDYRKSLTLEEELETQLEQLLKDEPLRLFKQYMDHCDNEGGLSNISAFYKGLAMGMKLGFFAMSDR